MKPLLFCTALILLTLTICLTTNADIAKPKPSVQAEPKPLLHTSLEIATDPKGFDARLIFHESELKELRAALDGADRNTTIAASIAHSSTRTIIAGVLMFASVSFAGVWFARSRRTGSAGRVQKMAVIALVSVSILGAAAIITRGNAGPPPYYRWKNITENLKKGESTYGSVNIEVVPDDPNGSSHGIRVVLPLRKQGEPGEE